MKRFFAVLMAIVACFAALSLTACNSKGEKTLVIAVPDGAPTLALYSMMDTCNTLEGYNIEYKVLTGAANIGTTVVSGEADCAIMPVNVAAKLYNKGTDIKLMSVNTFGNLYMVGKQELTSMEELKGKIVLNIGQGGTPDISLKAILDGNKIPYEISETPIEGKVALKYVGDGSEVIAMLKAGKAEYGVMGEPAVSNAVKATGGKIVMDIQREWANIVGDNSFMQAGFVVSKSVYENKELCNAIYNKLAENNKVILENPEKVKSVITRFGSTSKIDYTTEILKRCNLGNKKATEIKSQIVNYFNAVKGYDATFIGEKLPDDNFYLEF